MEFLRITNSSNGHLKLEIDLLNILLDWVWLLLSMVQIQIWDLTKWKHNLNIERDSFIDISIGPNFIHLFSYIKYQISTYTWLTDLNHDHSISEPDDLINLSSLTNWLVNISCEPSINTNTRLLGQGIYMRIYEWTIYLCGLDWENSSFQLSECKFVYMRWGKN